MRFRDNLQSNRFEFKYIVSEAYAAAVRDFACGYLVPDPYADPHQGNSYQLSSLYLDTPELSLYQQTVVGQKNRFKLRIRFYDDSPGGPALLEVKRRVNAVILKERAMVTRDGVRRLLDGQPPDPSWLLGGNGDARSADALRNFCKLSNRTAAGPSIYVSYRREAYVLPDNNSVRVTFDRQLLGSFYEHEKGLLLPTHGARPRIGNGDKVVLELKFTNRFPEWMHELAQLFGLQRTSVPKYVLCIDALGFRPGMTTSHRNGNGKMNHRSRVSTKEQEPASDERTPAEANGDLSIMPIHMADVASDYYEREFALSLVESGDQTLRQIEEALERMVAGVYAVCKSCEAKIPKARLNAVPYTTLCVKCASQNDCE